MTPERKAALKRAIKKRLIVYGGLAALLYGLYLYQPMRFDLMERKPEEPLPLIDPDSETLFSKGTRVLVVSAHPDDSEFYIGGTLHLLSKTADIFQIVCTDGDKSYYGPFADSASLRKVRRQESIDALNAWRGNEITFLGFPDGRLFPTDELVGKIEAKIREVKPDYILAFDGDFPPRISHRDHRNAGIAAELAAKKVGIGKWLLRYSTVADNYVVDISDVWDAKAKLLALHKSQFAKKQEGIDNMVMGLAEMDGERTGVQLGEGFRATRISALDRD
jgi:LmbE family N-acetylglucosaminyl deacetylase